jgi:hypothetical protein
MKFSERIGITKAESILQIQGMNSDLRNSLWNVLDIFVWQAENFMYCPYENPGIVAFSHRLWFSYFKEPIDEIPDGSDRKLKAIRDYFFKCPWNEIYDILEFIVNIRNEKQLAKRINDILERELSGYRLVGGSFVPVTDELEVEAVEKAISDSRFSNVNAHLKQALHHLARKETPDYRNSIKESISAVESMAREVSGNPKATLGDALALLEKTNQLHPALKRGFSAIYGYTNDENGIRHAMMDDPQLTVNDAKFFLVSCATFINYLKTKMS